MTYAQTYSRRKKEEQRAKEASLERALSSAMPLYCAIASSQLLVSIHRVEPGLPFCDANLAVYNKFDIRELKATRYQHFLFYADYLNLMSTIRSSTQGSFCCALTFKQDRSITKHNVCARLCCPGNGLVIIIAQSH